MWLVPPAPTPDQSAVAKSALGSDRFVTSEVCATGPEAVARARAAGMTTVAIELTTDAVPLFTLDLGPSVCLVLGHENRGVHKDTLAAVDRVAFLPQLGKIGSLNVAQAGTIALYEVARQLWISRPSTS
jgi:tRNA (guanosine-2'-O-)-methyltransferase